MTTHTASDGIPMRFSKSLPAFAALLAAVFMLPMGVGLRPVDAETLADASISVDMVAVSSGRFEMGRPYTDVGFDDEIPVHEVYLDAYLIGRYPVINQEYATVLNWAHGQGYLEDSSGGNYTGGRIYAYGRPITDTASSVAWAQITYDGDTFSVCSRAGHEGQLFSKADHPVLRVSWYGAVAFCNWLSEIHGKALSYDTEDWKRFEPVRNGYRLPTEAEWERAAAWDGSRHWRYAFAADTLDATRANYGGNIPLELATTPYTTPVGWYDGANPARLLDAGRLTTNSPSPVGAYDMTGNAWEWCHDWYQRDYYTRSSGRNPTGPRTGAFRVLRGGSWYDGPIYCRTAKRSNLHPGSLCSFNGFRVARSRLQ